VHVTVAGEVVGSVAIAPGGGAALLYSNATKLERITVLTLAATPTYRVVKLHAPVLSVFPAATAPTRSCCTPTPAARWERTAERRPAAARPTAEPVRPTRARRNRRAPRGQGVQLGAR
jgi:hypothetical protein